MYTKWGSEILPRAASWTSGYWLNADTYLACKPPPHRVQIQPQSSNMCIHMDTFQHSRIHIRRLYSKFNQPDPGAYGMLI